MKLKIAFAFALSVFKPLRKRCRNRKNNAMKRALRELVALLATANLTALSDQVSPEPAISGEHIALIGGTVINPADGKITRNATVFVDNGRITNIAANMVMKFGGRTPSIAPANSFCRDTSTRMFISFNQAICSRGPTLSI